MASPFAFQPQIYTELRVQVRIRLRSLGSGPIGDGWSMIWIFIHEIGTAPETQPPLGVMFELHATKLKDKHLGAQH